MPRGTVFEGVKLRAWADAQRVKWKAGTLSAERVAALEEFEGWWWVAGPTEAAPPSS